MRFSRIFKDLKMKVKDGFLTEIVNTDSVYRPRRCRLEMDSGGIGAHGMIGTGYGPPKTTLCVDHN